MPVRPLPPNLAEKARVELNEDPSKVNDALQSIKDWIAEQPHLNARTDDQWLIAFLRGCKYNLEKTKDKLELFYTFKTNTPELSRIKHNDRIFMDILNLGSVIVTPKDGTPDGTRVSLVRFANYDPNKYHLMDVMEVGNMMMRILLMDDDNFMVAGFRSIVDLGGMTMTHFLQMTPMNLKKIITMSQESAPLRMKGIHFVNMPASFEIILNVIKSIFNKKNRSRIFVHGKDKETLYQYIPKEMLPIEYGGNEGTMEEIIEHWRNKVKEYGPWLEEDVKYGTDESKRIHKPSWKDMFSLRNPFRSTVN